MFVDDHLSDLEAGASETLSESSTMTYSSGPAAESNQKQRAEIAQAQIPASILDETVEDAISQSHGKRGRH